MPPLNDASLTVSLAMIAGVLAQGIAVHLRLPGIVLLLAVGVLLGPDVAGLVRPEIMGGGLHAFVGFAVAIILFEGGLSLNLSRLRRQARPIRRLVTLGAVLTAVLGAVVARLVMPGWDWRLAILFGTLVIVTGPTVITPLLRRLSIRKNVDTILEAEGVFVDAVGATIAVVALEASLAWTATSAAAGILDVALRLAIGGFVGLVGGALLALLIRWRNVAPEGMENILALAFAIATFQVSNALVHESGITAAIVAGMVISNTQSHAFREIVEFKEQLTSFFIATLFVLLAADVRVADVLALGWPGLLTVALLMIAVRPAMVVLSTWGTGLDWREKAFLSWLAPRGIVAAAVASLFAIRLAEHEIPGGVEMRALVFLVIAMTVTIQGLSGGPVASLLGLRRARNTGFLFLGANALARLLADRLRRSGQPVALIDTNADACKRAEADGFEVVYGNGLESAALLKGRAEERKAAIAVTPNESINFLFARKIRESYRGLEAYVGLVTENSGVTADMAEQAHAHVLFGKERPLGMWIRRLEGGQLDTETWELGDVTEQGMDFARVPGNALLPLLAFRDGEPFLLRRRIKMRRGDLLEILVRPEQRDIAEDWLRGAGFAPARVGGERDPGRG